MSNQAIAIDRPRGCLALGTILFGAVLLLFLVYDRVLGLDRLRLGS